MGIYKIMRCSSCGAPIKESEIRKDIYVTRLSSDKPSTETYYELHLCDVCASAFDKALANATEWERNDETQNQ